jgi:hypothetical protein
MGACPCTVLPSPEQSRALRYQDHYNLRCIDPTTVSLSVSLSPRASERCSDLLLTARRFTSTYIEPSYFFIVRLFGAFCYRVGWFRTPRRMRTLSLKNKQQRQGARQLAKLSSKVPRSETRLFVILQSIPRLPCVTLETLVWAGFDRMDLPSILDKMPPRNHV